MANLKAILISAAVISAVLFVLVFGLVSIVHKSDNLPGATQTSNERTIITFYPESLTINAEVADNESERERGLMFRQSLGKNDGMIFIYTDSAVRSFWMKNMLIPLDIIFIDENRIIVKILRAAPCASDPCSSYNSGKPVKYVLEVNENISSEYGIKEGDRVELS